VSERTLVLWRHGRTAWNESGRGQGHADIPLDEVGHAQAAASAAMLARLSPARLWTSDLLRAVQTAAYLAALTGLTPEPDKRLREYDLGARQGLTLDEFAAAFPAGYAAWFGDDRETVVPGAETRAEVAARIVPALEECLAALDSGQTGVVVTHGASLKVGLLGVLGWGQERSQAIRGMDNCAWAVLVEGADGLRRLTAYNRIPGGGDDFASDSGVG